jgi:hypothetical protein
MNTVDEACARHAARPRALFPTLNKQDRLEHNERQHHAGECRRWAIEVAESMELSAGDYDELAHALLAPRRWPDKGGTCTDAPGMEDADPPHLAGAERDRWMQLAYRRVVTVSAPDRRIIYVDPQGYEYARHVAFPAATYLVAALFTVRSTDSIEDASTAAAKLLGTREVVFASEPRRVNEEAIANPDFDVRILSDGKDLR